MHNVAEIQDFSVYEFREEYHKGQALLCFFNWFKDVFFEGEPLVKNETNVFGRFSSSYRNSPK